MPETVKPYCPEGSKKAQVEEMFNRIAPRYDLLNRLLSLGIDQRWRRRVVRGVRNQQAVDVLDLATGTGDLALALARIPGTRITGLDIARDMLALAEQKGARSRHGKGIRWVHGDGESLPFEDRSFDAVTIAFGIRNYEDPLQGLREMHRVLRPGGKVYVLEFSRPRKGFFQPVFMLYFRYLLPAIGRLISRDSSAYTYLPASVEAFADGEAFLSLMRESGFTDVSQRPMTFGVATLYVGER